MNFYLLPVLLTKQKILSSDEFRIKIKHHLNHDLLDTAKFFRVSLLEMNKENVQDIVVLFCFVFVLNDILCGLRKNLLSFTACPGFIKI